MAVLKIWSSRSVCAGCSVSGVPLYLQATLDARPPFLLVPSFCTIAAVRKAARVSWPGRRLLVHRFLSQFVGFSLI
jgi:hypothetical protein